MTTITIPKTEYKEIIKTQEKLSQKLDLIQRMIIELIRDEINSQYSKKINRLSQEIDQGKGIKFSNLREMKKYLNSL